MATGSLCAVLVGVALGAYMMTSRGHGAESRPPEAEAPPLTTPDPPIRNLRVDPATLHVTWDVVAGGGAKFLCQKGQRRPLRAQTKPRPYCDFPSSLSVCNATNITVFPVGQREQAARIQFRPREADPDHDPRGLSCVVREADALTLTCRWGRGPAAPEDLRYRMFWRDARLRPDHDRECACPEDDGDRGERCTVTLDPDSDPVTLVIVTVNVSRGGVAASGGGAGAALVACSDLAVDLAKAAELASPTLMGQCNGSEARVTWAMRSRFHHEFEFTLQINRSSHSEPQYIEVHGKKFEIVNARKLSVRVRARPAEGGRVSGWSPALRLACDPATPAEATAAMMAAWMAVGTGTTLLLLLLLLWRRKSLIARLCPPIPRMRVPVDSTMAAMIPGETVAWAVAAEDCEVTPVVEA